MGIVDILASIAKVLPEVKAPERPPQAKERLMWTGIALVLFFFMYHITVFGVQISFAGIDFLQTITASRIGSLLTTGIGPLVLSSIFLQLFVGAGLIKLNLQDKKDKQKFQEAQKVLAIVLALVEGGIFASTALSGSIISVGGLSYEVMMAIVVIQIALGSVAMLYLDEIVSKYGIGSGISLFIAAGVSQAIIGGLIALIFGETNSVIAALTGGGAESISRALLVLLPFFFSARSKGTQIFLDFINSIVSGTYCSTSLKASFSIPALYPLANKQTWANTPADKTLSLFLNIFISSCN